MFFYMTNANKNIHSQSNPVGRPRGSSYPAQPLSNAQIRTLYGSCFGAYGLYHRAFISFGLFAGMRVGSIAKLTIGQVLDSHGNIRDHIVFQSTNEKSKRTHSYTLAPKGKQYIKEYINTLTGFNLVSPLFPSKRGGGFMNPSSASRMVTRLLLHAGIEQNTSHSLRKSFARACYVDLSLGIYEISTLLSHSSIETTKIYLGNLQPNIEKALSNLSY
jgi:integrase/recombinase XerD